MASPSPTELPSALAFRCTGCGNCCRTLRVAVTASDVARLVSQSGRRASELVAWLAPEHVDMTGEPESFVELSEGRRLMVLAQHGDACCFLGADNRCRVYAARPRDCRAFPFDFERTRTAETARRLKLLPLEGCEYANDGQHDAVELARLDAERWLELSQYWAIVAQWNRRGWHRRRLHKSVGSAEQFLEYSLTRLNERAE